MKIWSHTLVRNEERYIWYAVASVIDWVDKALIWDTGSTDKTVRIIKEIKKIYPDKVSFRKLGPVNPEEFTDVRQKMLDETKSDWFILVDGDEVWWEGSIKKLTKTIRKKGGKLETIVTPSYLLVGDIYHYQEEKAGRYEIDGRRGHLNIRAMNRRIPGLHLEKPHGTQGFFDKDSTLIQERPKEFRKFLNVYHLHFTHLPRSSTLELDKKVPKRAMKLKYELGIPFPKDFYYPEVFFKPKPDIVPSPWQKMDLGYIFKASLLTLPRKMKRRLIKGGSGY